jgi:transcription elongation factor Elf1
MFIELPFICPLCETEITSDDVISDQNQIGVVHKIQCAKCQYSKVFFIDTE